MTIVNVLLLQFFPVPSIKVEWMPHVVLGMMS